jgi:hypothetical protein
VTGDLDAYLDQVYGDDSGFVHGAFGTGQYLDSERYAHRQWTPQVYPWPADRARLAADIAAEAMSGADVYLCPNLMTGDKRTKDDVAARRQIHADCDSYVDPDKVKDLDGWAVSSGTPGHAQVYVTLTESVSRDHYHALEVELHGPPPPGSRAAHMLEWRPRG